MNEKSTEVDGLMSHLANVPFRFWVCPVGCKGFVDWTGDVATCRECGKRSDGGAVLITPKVGGRRSCVRKLTEAR